MDRRRDEELKTSSDENQEGSRNRRHTTRNNFTSELGLADSGKEKDRRKIEKREGGRNNGEDMGQPLRKSTQTEIEQKAEQLGEHKQAQQEEHSPKYKK